MNNNRLPEFDILKGYLVFFVVGLHLLTNFFEVFGINIFMGWQLPLFFWVTNSEQFTSELWQCALIIGTFILNMIVCFAIIKIKKIILCKKGFAI